MSNLSPLLAVSPLDGRYAEKTDELRLIVSEYGLIKYRVTAEAAWLKTLGSGILPDVEPLSSKSLKYLQAVADNFSAKDASEIKTIEKTTNHDVKAVENWLKAKLSEADSKFDGYSELIHFGCTSEDINNLAYAMMLKELRDKVIIPNLTEVRDLLEEKRAATAEVPMLARTHGQPATPTTLGKEMAVFSERIRRSIERLSSIEILGKFNGASGNYNAASFAFPEVDWPKVSRTFVKSLGFEFNPVTTQIEPHDWMAAYFNEVSLSNTIMTDLSRDMWTYISQGYFTQKVVTGEVGSSTMPHKVNPIDFENAEANLGAANALLVYLAGKLPVSRLQRDLSDSSAQRTIGEAMGHTLVAFKSLMKGLGKVNPNTDKIASDLEDEWSVLTEAVQTVMRRYKVAGAYDIIKNASRGKALTKAGYLDMVSQIDIPESEKTRLLALTPSTYIGKASHIAKGNHN